MKRHYLHYIHRDPFRDLINDQEARGLISHATAARARRRNLWATIAGAVPAAIWALVIGAGLLVICFGG